MFDTLLGGGSDSAADDEDGWKVLMWEIWRVNKRNVLVCELLPLETAAAWPSADELSEFCSDLARYWQGALDVCSCLSLVATDPVSRGLRRCRPASAIVALRRAGCLRSSHRSVGVPCNVSVMSADNPLGLLTLPSSFPKVLGDVVRQQAHRHPAPSAPVRQDPPPQRHHPHRRRRSNQQDAGHEPLYDRR